jgi:hypothetical protein
MCDDAVPSTTHTQTYSQSCIHPNCSTWSRGTHARWSLCPSPPPHPLVRFPSRTSWSSLCSTECFVRDAEPDLRAAWGLFETLGGSVHPGSDALFMSTAAEVATLTFSLDSTGRRMALYVPTYLGWHSLARASRMHAEHVQHMQVAREAWEGKEREGKGRLKPHSFAKWSTMSLPAKPIPCTPPPCSPTSVL